MTKRVVAAAVVAATAGGLFAGPMAGSASACTDTVNTVIGSVTPGIDVSCPPPSCPSPTRPYAAVYVDGRWVMVCL